MIRVTGLGLRAGAFVLEDVSFSVATGQYAVLMGRTGSGKTTLLEALCGLKEPHAGTIELMGVDVTKAKPALRGVGYVPQDGALFSTLTVREHLGFALSIRGWPAQKIEARARELSELLGIGHLLGRLPRGLSGGERQRVALGRALAARPGILCLDEPLSALDEETREDTCALLHAVQRHEGVTTLHVTHSSREAQRLADCVLYLHDGRIETATGLNGRASDPAPGPARGRLEDARGPSTAPQKKGTIASTPPPPLFQGGENNCGPAPVPPP